MKNKKTKLMLAKGYGGAAAKAALGLAGVLFSLIILGLMFSALQGLESVPLRVAITAVGLFSILSFFVIDGVTAGAKDTKQSDFCMRLTKEKKTPEAHALSLCYHPMKPVITCAIVFTVPVLLGLFIAANAGVSQMTQVPGPMDWVRLAARLPVMVWLNLFGDPSESMVIIDRMTPLFSLSYPIMYVVGYLLGPQMFERQKKDMRRANKLAARKAGRSKLAEQLTKTGADVHYGEAQTAKHAGKKNELI